jgi:hypothetical protein
MGQLLNLGFKNVCNNGNLGVSPNVEIAEIINLVSNSEVSIPFYNINNGFAGVFNRTFQAPVGVILNKNIFGGAGQMIDLTFVNTLKDNDIFVLDIKSTGGGGSVIGDQTLNINISDTEGNTTTESYCYRFNQSRSEEFKKRIIFTVGDLKKTNTLNLSSTNNTDNISISLNIISI